ncbi:group III truncated hemoglobin [uncultured Brachyspira sp.]|uniref:group III truncated hemoglobin n=1 Tax=uncultured Brachyspira sp. TaxID=221953 RepID=UPI0025CFDE2C|nr:group III truncated hemoglobin [uncultured Brachyspira sp.]
MKYTEINVEGIEKLMDIFYARIRTHEQLGPIFNGAVGIDDESWERHKEKISKFWRTMLLNERLYMGNPVQPHINLLPFDIKMFDIWLSLFKECLNEVFEEKAADKYYEVADNVGKNFKAVLFQQ